MPKKELEELSGLDGETSKPISDILFDTTKSEMFLALITTKLVQYDHVL